MNTEDNKEIDEIDAKGGRCVKGMPFVLGVSLVSIISLSIIVFAVFAA